MAACTMSLSGRAALAISSAVGRRSATAPVSAKASTSAPGRAAIALANKLAHIAWAVLARGHDYEPRTSIR